MYSVEELVGMLFNYSRQLVEDYAGEGHNYIPTLGIHVAAVEVCNYIGVPEQVLGWYSGTSLSLLITESV